MRSLFDLTAPLPRGTTVLEASAGTGKTFAIAALAARYIAEGVAGIDDLLLITFSRAATAELRSRVRERLRETADALGAATHGVRPEEVVAAGLADAPPEEVALRRDRLADAFARFDRAAIMTTHEFCHGMLAGLGVLAPQTPQSTLVEDLRPLADEAAEDVYLRMFADAPEGAPFPFGRVWDADPGARDIARQAVFEVADLVGAGTPGTAGVRVEFAEAVRAEVASRKRERRLFSFDDQLTRLADALSDEGGGEQARARLAARFPVVLVDEFQDTDPTQWRVLRSAFGGRSTLVLIGDPKQAIYGFRGGDVHTYSLAVEQADGRTTLGVNHRSDPEVVEGVGLLFAGVELGEAIVAPPVAHRHEPRLVGEPGTAWERGVQVRALESDKAVHPATARRAITTDLVGLVGGLLAPSSPLRAHDRALRPSDIAVLVRTNDRGQELAAALRAAGLPATFNGTNSVLASDAAADWLTLLRALDLRTGRFTSPHVERMTERISIDGEPLTDEEFVRAFNDVAPYTHLVDATQEHPLSFFETVVAMAYAAFADAPADVAVVEVGMGGSWDATNVVDAAVAVVLPVAVDHAAYLGDSATDIAREKAGIIKPGSIAVLAQQSPEVDEILLERIAEVGATAVREGLDFGVAARSPAVGGQMLSLQGLRARYDDVFVPLYGAHQAQNAAVALAAVEAFLAGGDQSQPLDAEVVRAAFAEVTSPGRLEIVRRSPTVAVSYTHLTLPTKRIV